MRLSTPFRRIAGYAGLSLLLAFAGCKNGDLPPIAKVKGTVTYKGKPVPNMMVNFMPTAGRPSWGQTDAAGRYETNYDADTMGVMVGHHKVYFNSATLTIDAGTSKKSKEEAAVGSGLTAEELTALLAKYGKEDSTKLEVDVTKDTTTLDLKLD